MAEELEFLKGILVTRIFCQNQKCKADLGVVHLPALGGFVAINCPRCKHTSLFINEAYGIRKACSPTAEFNKLLGRR